MEGLYFLFNIIGIGLIMWWMIENDKVGLFGATSGLFAMRDEGETPPATEPPTAKPGPIAGAKAGWRSRASAQETAGLRARPVGRAKLGS